MKKTMILIMAVATTIKATPAWKNGGLDTPNGYIALQSEVPLGGQFDLRTIKLTEPK